MSVTTTSTVDGSSIAKDDNLTIENIRLDAIPAASYLSVSDVERLAKAGVKIDINDIKTLVRPDEPEPTTPIIFDQFDHHGLLGAFLKRWDMAKPTGAIPGSFNAYARQATGGQDPYRFSHASIVGDPNDENTIHVFVLTACGKAAHITDERYTFPSEALMAKLIFLFNEGK